jgi:hypothetical protein
MLSLNAIYGAKKATQIVADILNNTRTILSNFKIGR